MTNNCIHISPYQTYPYFPPRRGTCPNCGYCPNCGRANGSYYWGPYWWGSQAVTIPPPVKITSTDRTESWFNSLGK
jgi:hypothetical protein